MIGQKLLLAVIRPIRIGNYLRTSANTRGVWYATSILLLATLAAAASPSPTGLAEGQKLAAELLQQQRNEQAAEVLDRAVRHARDRGEAGLELAGALNDLGTLYHDLDRLHEAERCYRESIALLERTAGSDGNLAIGLSNLAGLRVRAGKYSEAEDLLRRAEQLFASVFGPASPAMATAYCGLAGIYLDTKQHRKAHEYSERALEVLEKSVHDERLGTAFMLLARVAWVEGRSGDTGSLIRRALAAWQVSIGTEHQTHASGLASLAVALSASDPPEADRLFQQSVAVLETRLGRNHSYVGQTLLLYAKHLESHRRKGEAKAMKRRAATILSTQPHDSSRGFSVDVMTLKPSAKTER